MVSKAEQERGLWRRKRTQGRDWQPNHANGGKTYHAMRTRGPSPEGNRKATETRRRAKSAKPSMPKFNLPEIEDGPNNP